MSRLPPMSGAEICRVLMKVGFVRVSQKGSHVKLRHILADHVTTVIVPMHNELAPGTLRSILRQAGLDAAEIERLLG